MMQRRGLTEELIRREYLEKDVSMRQACESLGCCPTTLVKAMKRMGIQSKPRTWNHRRKNRFPQLQNRAWLQEQLKTRTMMSIAKELGTSSGNVSDYVRRHGLRWKHYDRMEAVKEGIRKAGIKSGDKASNWRGGRIKTGGGHVYSYKPEHPAANKGGYVMEHRLVMESILGRYLRGDEVVHHKNGIKDDNRPENLQVMTIAEHRKEHMDAHRKLHEAMERIAYLESLLKENSVAFH